MLSQGEDEATDLLSKATFMHGQLPDFLRVNKGKDQSSLVTFPSVYSEIRALPSTEKAGHGYSGSLVIRDELEHHPYAKENFAAIGPSVDRGMAQQIDLSTANKLKIDTHFKERFIGARSGDNGAFPVFIPVQARACTLKGITYEDWYKGLLRKYPSWVIEQEYPTTEQDALGTLRSIPFFDPDRIQLMRTDIREPMKHELSARFPTVSVYRERVVGERYCMFADPSDGKEDPHAIIVMNKLGEEVASSHGKVTADYCALIHDGLARYYFDAFNNYELNARAGGIFSQKMKELGTPNQCAFINPEGKKAKTLSDGTQKKGFWTGQKLKETILQGLEEAVRLGQITIHTKECLDEFEAFTRPEGEDPKSPIGGHDDYIMAWAGVWFTRRYMIHSPGNVQSFDIKG